jgi:hypothetical protein
MNSEQTEGSSTKRRKKLSPTKAGYTEGNLVCGEEGISGTLIDEWRRASSGGASLCEGFREGDLEGGLLYWGTRKMRFLRDMQNAL